MAIISKILILAIAGLVAAGDANYGASDCSAGDVVIKTDAIAVDNGSCGDMYSNNDRVYCSGTACVNTINNVNPGAQVRCVDISGGISILVSECSDDGADPQTTRGRISVNGGANDPNGFDVILLHS